MSVMTSAATPQSSKFFWLSFPALCLIALSLIVLSLIPSSRETIRSLVISNSRQVLAKAEADLTRHGLKVAVVKVKTADSLALEIFESDPEKDQFQFIKRLVLPEPSDAYFTFHGNATNLVVTDIDGDGILEIIAPTFDENLMPRLNVFKYDPESKDFFRLGPENYHL